MARAGLTVILPNYNHGQFLSAAFEALLAQTRVVDELIVIDDNSRDNSLDVIELYLPRFHNSRFIRNTTNTGTVANMNAGLRMASGAVVAFVAADDVTYPMYFERAGMLLDQFPQAAFASGRCDLIDINGGRICEFPAPSPLKRAGFISSSDAAQLLSKDDAWFTGNVTAFRTQPLRELGGFPTDLAAFTDGFVSRVLAVKYGTCYSPEAWGAWRRLEGGLAWTQTESLETVVRLANLGERRLRESDAPFAKDYPSRWKGRYIFGARRFAFVMRLRRVKAKSTLSYTLSCAVFAFLTAWYFLRLRPRDIWPVIYRRVWKRSR